MPTEKGQREGQQNGLSSDLSLIDFTFKLDLNKFNNYYWIGFSVGYHEGQIIRNKLKNSKGELSFEEKIDCCKYFYQQSSINSTDLQDYLSNIQNWHIQEMDDEIYRMSLDFLDNKKNQRSIDCIFLFYKNNFRLKALKDFHDIYQSLKDVRVEKRKESNYNLLENIEKIELKLRSWISRNKQA